MTNEHLRPLLDDWASMQVLFKAGEVFGLIPESVVHIVKMGRMTALSKSDGGVRGIVAGDVFRRLIARTMAKQFGRRSDGGHFASPVCVVNTSWM